MPGQIQAVPGTNTIYATMQASIARSDDESSVMADPRSSYRLRGMLTREQGWTHRGGRWPSSRGMGFYSDPAAPSSMIFGGDECCAAPGDFEPWRFGNQGTQSLKFIMGTCKDSVGGTVSGAIVQGFITATDAFVGETTADSNGRYELGTPNPGTQHYLVAYRAGAPDIAGTTVNTLTPTNRDGT